MISHMLDDEAIIWPDDPEKIAFAFIRHAPSASMRHSSDRRRPIAGLQAPNSPPARASCTRE